MFFAVSFSFPFWFSGNQHLLGHSRHLMQSGFCKPRVSKHFFVLRKSIGVSGIGANKHVEAEGGCRGRSHAVFVGDELESKGLSARFKGGVNAAHQRLACWLIEMVENIRE